MRQIVLSLVIVVCGSVAFAADETKTPFPFKSGDRVMFLGDSITEQYQYSTIIEMYLTTRFPQWKLTFLNAGIGGDTATGGARRFQSHVLNEKPTIVTINFGMNDGGYGGFNKGSAANYVKQTEAMLNMAQKAGVRVALISPNAVEVKARPGLATYLETQKQFYAPLKKLAEKHELPFVDQYAVTRKVLDKIAEEKAKVSPFPDGVHTNLAGGLLMAHTILTGLHAPAVVSDVTIDTSAKSSKETKCKIANLEVNDAGVSFERTDEAIPMPINGQWKAILPFVNNLKDLNYYGLKVTGLKAGTYKVSIDGTEVGSFSEQELAGGVNLGNIEKGPLHEQGVKVAGAVIAKNNVVHNRFRNVVMFNAPEWLKDVVAERKPVELKKQLEKIETMQAAIWKLATPKPHKFTVTAAK